MYPSMATVPIRGRRQWYWALPNKSNLAAITVANLVTSNVTVLCTSETLLLAKQVPGAGVDVVVVDVTMEVDATLVEDAQVDMGAALGVARDASTMLVG